MEQTLEGCETEGKKSGPWSFSSVTLLLLKTTYQVATVSMEAFLSFENITVYSNLLYVLGKN